MQAAKFVLLVALGLGTVGCAQNAARLDIAKGVSEKSKSAMSDVAAYYDDIETRRRRAAATLVASDPSCLPEIPIRLQRPRRPGLKRAPLCPTAGLSPNHIEYELDFGPTPDAILKPRILMVAAVADYGAALAKILADPGTDVTAELTSFAEKADRVGSLIGLLSGRDVPTLGGVIQSPEGASVFALIKFADELRHEANQVGNVKALVLRDGAVVDEALRALKVQVDTWARGDLASASYVHTQSLSQAYELERHNMNFGERRAAAQDVFDARAQDALLPDRSKKIVSAIEETQAAQQELRDALSGKFSKKRQRQIVRLNADRITRALELIAGVGRAFI